MSGLLGVLEELDEDGVLPLYVFDGNRSQACALAVQQRCQGYVYYTTQAAVAGVRRARLHLTFGSSEDWITHAGIGRMVQEAFQQLAGMCVAWDGREVGLLVGLGPDDLRHLGRQVDTARTKLATRHRLSVLWRTLRTGLVHASSDEELLRQAFEAWSALPGGPLFKRAQQDWALLNGVVEAADGV